MTLPEDQEHDIKISAPPSPKSNGCWIVAPSTTLKSLVPFNTAEQPT